MGKSKKHESKHKKINRKEKKSKKRLKEKKKDHTGKKIKNKVNDGMSNEDFSIPLELMHNKSHAPETPEEYQQRQNRIRREVDPVTGRSRLIKGDGEILEEIVSKERHRDINKEATKGDGEYFQENTLGKR